MKTWRRELSLEPPNHTIPGAGLTMHTVTHVNGVSCAVRVMAEGIIKGLPEEMAFG